MQYHCNHIRREEHVVTCRINIQVTYLGKEILFLLHYYHLFPTIVLHGSKKPWNQVQVSWE